MVLVRDAGVSPLQIVWAEPISPAVGVDCTVICTVAVGLLSQATEFWVETVILLNQVVWVKAPGA